MQQKLTKKSEFELLYATGSKRIAGPLLIHTLANSCNYSRFGLSVPKRVGNAVERNRIKRLCREAFRLSQHGFRDCVDVLVTVRPHAPLTLPEYQELLLNESK